MIIIGIFLSRSGLRHQSELQALSLGNKSFPSCLPEKNEALEILNSSQQAKKQRPNDGRDARKPLRRRSFLAGALAPAAGLGRRRARRRSFLADVARVSESRRRSFLARASARLEVFLLGRGMSLGLTLLVARVGGKV